MRSRYHSLHLLTLVVAASTASVVHAHASHGDPTLGIYVSGPRAPEVEASIAATMGEGCDYVDRGLLSQAVAAATKKMHRRHKQSTTWIDDVRAAGAELGADLMIVGSVRRERGTHKLWLAAVDAGNHAPLVNGVVAVSRYSRKARRTEWMLKRVAAVLSPVAEHINSAANSKAPASDAPAAAAHVVPNNAVAALPEWAIAAKPEPDARELPKLLIRDEDQLQRSRNPHSAFIVGKLGTQIANRFFSYGEPASEGLEDYSRVVVPTPMVALELYPLARPSPLGWITTNYILRNLGLTAGFAHSVADRSPTRPATWWRQVDAGLTLRMPFGAKDSFALSAQAGWQHIRYTFEDQSDGAEPDVSYQMVRTGVRASYVVGRLTLSGGGGLLVPVITSGRIGSKYFPRSRSLGFDARAAIGLEIWGGLGLELSGSYTRITHQLRSEANDRYIADTAVDQIASGAANLRYVF